MANKFITLAAAATATTVGKYWTGGRTALLVSGTLATTTKLQILGQDAAWYDVATISAAGLTAYDLAPGNYRMSLAGGSPSVNADLYGVTYDA